MLTRELRFNVGGDPRDDQPWLQPDNPPGHAPIAGIFESPGRLLTVIPDICTGGATLSYQHQAKSFRVILPPIGEQFQAEAGEPPQLPPEYHGDPDKVALHYEWIDVRPGQTRVDGRIWFDDAGQDRPIGITNFAAAGFYMRGQSSHVARDFAFMQAQKLSAYRALCSVNGGPWTDKGRAIDPSDPAWLPSIAQMIDDGYTRYGLKAALTVIGGGCPDPVGIARRLVDMLALRKDRILCLEAVNEMNATTAEAGEIARVLAPLGLPFGVGLGNAGIDTIKDATTDAGASVAFFHQERSGPQNSGPLTEDQRKRNARQCWDYKEFPTASACGEPAGIKSSVAEINEAFLMAVMRAGDIICGAGYFVVHPGAGVFSSLYPYNDGVRHEWLDEVPNLPQQLEAVRHAADRIPAHAEAWHKTNGAQGPLPFVASGQFEKLYVSTGPGTHVGILTAAHGAIRIEPRQGAMQIEVSNPATGAIVAMQDLHPGEALVVGDLWAYVIVARNL